MADTSFEVIEHLTEPNRGEYRIMQGDQVGAYMKFSRLERLIILHHTEVRPLLRGKGAARTLLNYAANDARKRQLRIMAVCPFSRKTMEGNPEYADVYVSD